MFRFPFKHQAIVANNPCCDGCDLHTALQGYTKVLETRRKQKQDPIESFSQWVRLFDESWAQFPSAWFGWHGWWLIPTDFESVHIRLKLFSMYCSLSCTVMNRHSVGLVFLAHVQRSLCNLWDVFFRMVFATLSPDGERQGIFLHISVFSRHMFECVCVSLADRERACAGQFSYGRLCFQHEQIARAHRLEIWSC